MFFCLPLLNEHFLNMIYSLVKVNIVCRISPLSWLSSCFDIEPHAVRAERSRGEADDRRREIDSLAACLLLFQGGLKTVPAGMPCMVLCREKKPTQEIGGREQAHTQTHIDAHTHWCTRRDTHTNTHMHFTKHREARTQHLEVYARTNWQSTTTQTHSAHKDFIATNQTHAHTHTHTHTHNLCKWAPEAPWHVANAQLSCPHPVSRPNQSSPLHTGQQHGRRWKTTLMKDGFQI